MGTWKWRKSCKLNETLEKKSKICNFEIEDLLLEAESIQGYRAERILIFGGMDRTLCDLFGDSFIVTYLTELGKCANNMN
jgi:hypothetical protein